jgi:RimJ/RimL family protein N-acetyltransferase
VTEIQSERLTLAPIPREVAADLLAGRDPPGVTFADGYPSPFSLEVMDLLAGERAADTSDFRPLFMVRKAEGDVIGEIGGDLDTWGAVKVGFSIVEPLWGRGYATEALRALLHHLLVDLGHKRVTAETFPDHTASRRVMEKSGMQFVGIHVGVEDGREVELVVYEAVAGPI